MQCVFDAQSFFFTDGEVNEINVECRRAGIGCVDCKKKLAKNMNSYFAPFRARRADFENKPDQVWEILDDGAKRAGVIAKATMEEVRAAVGIR